MYGSRGVRDAENTIHEGLCFITITRLNMEMMLCQRCQKEIPKIATRKYCTACRIIVDKEMSRARSEKLRVPDELLKRKRKKSVAFE